YQAKRERSSSPLAIPCTKGWSRHACASARQSDHKALARLAPGSEPKAISSTMGSPPHDVHRPSLPRGTTGDPGRIRSATGGATSRLHDAHQPSDPGGRDTGQPHEQPQSRRVGGVGPARPELPVEGPPATAVE